MLKLWPRQSRRYEVLLRMRHVAEESLSAVWVRESAFHNPQLEAEECFLKTIEVVQRQQAKSLELRATMSLVQLRQQQAT